MSTATDLNSTEQVELDGRNGFSGANPMMKLDTTCNWTGRDELPFEFVGERMLEIDIHGSDGGETQIPFGNDKQRSQGNEGG